MDPVADLNEFLFEAPYSLLEDFFVIWSLWEGSREINQTDHMKLCTLCIGHLWNQQRVS